MRLDLDRPVGAGGPRLKLLMIARHRLRILQHVSREHRDHAVARPDHALADQPLGPGEGRGARRLDRKSTRLNSSHLVISYAVFCLKKKKTPKRKTHSSPTLHSCKTRSDTAYT